MLFGLRRNVIMNSAFVSPFAIERVDFADVSHADVPCIVV